MDLLVIVTSVNTVFTKMAAMMVVSVRVCERRVRVAISRMVTVAMLMIMMVGVMDTVYM